METPKQNNNIKRMRIKNDKFMIGVYTLEVFFLFHLTDWQTNQSFLAVWARPGC